jgi:hypothetical protein
MTVKITANNSALAINPIEPVSTFKVTSKFKIEALTQHETLARFATGMQPNSCLEGFGGDAPAEVVARILEGFEAAQFGQGDEGG